MTGKPQWTPTPADIESARITDFARHVEARTGLQFSGYQDLWQWSIDDLDALWTALWSYFRVTPQTPATALAGSEMPGATWFPGTRLNYVDMLARHVRSDRPAIIAVSEDQPDRTLSWADLLVQVAALAATLTELGVGLGDRVAGYLPNIPEAVVAFLATASIGAVWSGCGQDYTARAALDRLGQLDPTVLITADGYRFGGSEFDRRDEVAALRAGLPTVRATICVPRLFELGAGLLAWSDAIAGQHQLMPTAVEFDHPLWVLYSSGTTGLPKGIMHGHGGIVLEHLKALALHGDMGADDTLFWYTSPSWMMWNYQGAGLLVGATIVCYDGSPTYGRPDLLWQLAARVGATTLGASPGYVLACIKAGVEPRVEHDLAQLRAVGITGSTLPPSSSIWLADKVGARVGSISGGTDVATAFIGGTPTVSVWPGELSVPYLGVALDAYDEAGQPVRGEVGELVVTKPMPSMPIRFWNDPDGSRYRDAYFAMYPGVWRHGDWITITDRGSVEVHGRSDSTLNRNGIRMGSADIYQVVEQLPEVAEALVLGIEQPGGGYWMPLFVVLADGAQLDDKLREAVKAAIRTEVSPRHVPDEIIAAPGVPHTRTGKKLEVPLKRILQGADATRVVARSAVDDPALLDWYANVGQRR